MFEKTKINEKEADDGPFFKKIKNFLRAGALVLRLWEETQCCIPDGHDIFSHIFVVKIVMFV